MALGALIVFGCGGGGGTSATSGSTGVVSNIHVEAVNLANGAPEDLMNILVGDRVQARLYGLQDPNVRVQVASSNWSSDAPANVAVVSSSGTITTIGSSQGQAYIISGMGNGVKYTSSFIVRPVQAVVTALFRTQGGLPVQQADIKFFDSAGTVVGEATSQSNGSIRASVPATAVTFMASTNANTYATDGVTLFRLYDQFSYGANIWSDACSNRVPLPTLTNGTSTALPHNLVFTAKVLNDPNNPPPPPPDCGLGGGG